jgi:ABC-type multidrug transport system fused ATPase/permease subunit
VSDTLDWYQDYSSSINNLKLIFKRISSKPYNDFDNEQLKLGEIYMEQCRFGSRESQARECKERLFMEQSADTQSGGLWEKKDIRISNLSVSIKPGQRVCIMGMEGSGLDDIVKVFCGELEHMGGRFYKNGEISCLDV